MDLVIAFGVGVLLGGAVAVASMVAFMHYINKVFDKDEELRGL